MEWGIRPWLRDPPTIERWIHTPALPLVSDGQMLHVNPRRELITEGELMRQLRLQGVQDVSQVQKAYMEGDGRISVVAREPKTKGSPNRTLG